MDPNLYPQFVMKIWSEPDGHTERGVSIAGLGLIGECGEVCEILLERSERGARDAVCDECGDVLYYLAVLADWQGMSFMDVHAKVGFGRLPVVGYADSGLRLVKAAKEVSEMVKKWIRDGREYSQSEYLLALGEVMKNVGYVLQMHGRTLQDAINENVSKLEVRYAQVLAGETGSHQECAANAQ